MSNSPIKLSKATLTPIEIEDSVVYLRVPSARTMLGLQEQLKKSGISNLSQEELNSNTKATIEMMEILIMSTVCDSEGTLLFNESNRDCIMDLPIQTITKLTDAINKLPGMNPKEAEEVAAKLKNGKKSFSAAN